MRRRITSVVDQQHRLRELGRIRFGDRKRPKQPGKPLELPRVSSQDESIVHEIAAVYGGEPQPWEREDGTHEWDVKTTHPQGIAVACLPGIVPYTAAYEQWAGGFNTVRCDGEACQFRVKGRWVERACVCAERGQDFSERPCKRTTRITVAVLGIERLGVFRVDTKSFNAGEEVPATLYFLQESGRAAWMRMRQRADKVMVWDEKKGEDVPTGRRFPVIVVEAPFMVDEVMHLQRPASMAALPAPAAPALPRGARPQLGPGASIDPRGPQVGDREPPPREVPPVDLTPPPPVTGEVVDEAEDDAARAAAVQQALPLEHRAAAPGDA